jgi:colanic acid/amylovoran biosynthesis protein
MKNIKAAMYMHGGSWNHGCEAIVRSTLKILNFNETMLYSKSPHEDIDMSLDEICKIKKQGKNFRPYSFHHLVLKTESTLKGSIDSFIKWKYANVLKDIDKCDIWLSIGGDNYCGQHSQTMQYINKIINQRGKVSILWGCSIEPDYIAQNDHIDDFKRYDLITARESITFKALADAGLKENVKLIPDPAFTLDMKPAVLPDNFVEGMMVGINVSPLVQRREKKSNIVYHNCSQLIKHIISNTDYNIILIPHVVWDEADDLKILKPLYDEFYATNRLCMVNQDRKLDCIELKHVISKCRFMIAARTHASLAAYSTSIPTLVIGYSVKAKGIASDIFGTFEDYVIPVQYLGEEDALVKAFMWLEQHESAIKEHLSKSMPEYIDRTWLAGQEVNRIIESKFKDNKCRY